MGTGRVRIGTEKQREGDRREKEQRGNAEGTEAETEREENGGGAGEEREGGQRQNGKITGGDGKGTFREW